MSNYTPRPAAPGPRPRPSVFWPILLILGGVVMLLSNLGYLPEPSWAMVGRLWPVIFIALGIDLLIGRRSVAGAIISAMLILMLAAGFMALVFFARYIPALADLAREPALETYTFEHPLAGLEAAKVRIDWSSRPGELRALQDSRNLIQASITTYGAPDFYVTQTNNTVQVRIGARETTPMFGLRPGGSAVGQDWKIQLHPDIMLDLDLDCGSGRYDFDLSGLWLSNLRLDGGSGAIQLSLPADSSFEGRITGGSGELVITAPKGVGLRVLLDGGSGAFTVANLTRIEGDEDESVWESKDYANAETQIVLRIDQGSGAIRIQ